MSIKKKFVFASVLFFSLAFPKSSFVRASEMKMEMDTASVKTKLKNEYKDTKDKLIKEVDEYIASTSKSSRMTGKAIVSKSISEEFDITLLLAQCHIEGHFATMGRPKRTNSAFSVGCFDNGKSAFRYKHPDDSIEPYIKLVKYNYMNGRSVEQLLSSGFRNKNGAKYASAQDYVPRIRKCMSNIKKSTEIHSLYQTLLSLKGKIEQSES